jgi:hypothetical protein
VEAADSINAPTQLAHQLLQGEASSTILQNPTALTSVLRDSDASARNEALAHVPTIIAKFPMIDRAIVGEGTTGIFTPVEPIQQFTINQVLTAITNIAKTVTSIPNDDVLGAFANRNGSLQDTFAPDAIPLTLFLVKQNPADGITLAASEILASGLNLKAPTALLALEASAELCNAAADPMISAKTSFSKLGADGRTKSRRSHCP